MGSNTDTRPKRKSKISIDNDVTTEIELDD